MYGQSVPQITVGNITTKDNPGPLPINLHPANFSTVQPLDFTVLSEAAAVPVPHMENKETIYKLSQIVCVKADSSDTCQLFLMACLQEDVTVGMKRVKAKVFVQYPFNPVLFTEHAERYVNVSNIVCALTCYNYHDTLALEGDLILLLDELHHANEVVTIAEVAESVEMTETAVEEVQHERIPRKRKRRFESDFFLL